MKNPKLEAAQRRLFNGRTVLPDNPWPREFYSGIKPPKLYGKYTTDLIFRNRINADQLEAYVKGMPNLPTKEELLQIEVNALQELLNEKDELLDKLQRPMVIRMDWWLVGLVVTVLIAHGLGQI